MRGLFGDLGTMPLGDLVVHLGRRRASGVLGIEHGGLRKQAILRDGRVIHVSSNEPREFLARFLINLGHITEQEAARARDAQQETKVFLGKILVMIGAISESTLANALGLKVRETLLQAFHWTEGTFSFDADAAPELPDGFDVAIDLLDVHRENQQRESAWKTIRAVFPSPDAPLVLVERNLAETPRPGSLDERLVNLVREGRTIREILKGVEAPEFFLYQRLCALQRLDAVRVADPDEEALALDHSIDEESTVEDLLLTAQDFLVDGQYLDAEQFARRAFAMSATHQTESLLREAERRLLASIRNELAGGRAVVRLNVVRDKLKELDLTAPERYLLWRVDGVRDVAAIVMMSPLQELDALKCFKRFVDSGVLAVVDR